MLQNQKQKEIRQPEKHCLMSRIKKFLFGSITSKWAFAMCTPNIKIPQSIHQTMKSFAVYILNNNKKKNSVSTNQHLNLRLI